jgi:hypothetical protein
MEVCVDGGRQDKKHNWGGMQVGFFFISVH